jgi:hypothetical protein
MFFMHIGRNGPFSGQMAFENANLKPEAIFRRLSLGS